MPGILTNEFSKSKQNILRNTEPTEDTVKQGTVGGETHREEEEGKVERITSGH